MPRCARFCIEGVPLHIIQRGNNKSACFFCDSDRRLYLGLLRELAPEHDCSVHAYVLMTNHVHLLLTPQRKSSASLLMKNLGQRFVQFINRTHGRSGSMWEGRFRSSIVDSATYLLTCYRYIELNPVRAGMVRGPADYPWSSYRANALGEPSNVLDPHACYRRLGADEPARLAVYRSLFETALDDADLKAIREAVNAGLPLGTKAFVETIARATGRRTSAGVAGRPRQNRGQTPISHLAENRGLSPV